jgi:hypothetical protein
MYQKSYCFISSNNENQNLKEARKKIVSGIFTAEHGNKKR